MAAKRAYYRRIDRMTALQQENAELQAMLDAKDLQIVSLQAMVRRPELARCLLPLAPC